jgi:hypothetical protein
MHNDAPRRNLWACAGMHRDAQRNGDGPYWARTSDLRLVEPALSQLS